MERLISIAIVALASCACAETQWVPLKAVPYVVPGSAADCSAWAGPRTLAGSYGRVKAVGDHLEFEERPGEPVRFLGVNVTSACLTPRTDDDARAFAALLRRMGWNAVRIHHQEMAIVGDDGFSLDPGKMRRFDAFVAACIDEGLYLQTDLFVTRKVPGRELHEFKESILFDENSFSNYLAWAKTFLTHRNAITGRTLAEEPALAFLSLVNEGNVGNRKVDREEGWEKESAEAHRRFIRRMRRILRDELGVKAIISDMNGWTFKDEYLQVIGEECDLVDSHFYIDHPIYVGARRHRLPSRMNDLAPWSFFNVRPKSDISLKFDDRPYICTEWNWSAPGRWRGAGGLMTAAYAVQHGWDGLWRYSWGSEASQHEPFGRPSAKAHSLSYWDVARDPLMLASERAMGAIYLGGGKICMTNDVRGSHFAVSSPYVEGVVSRGRHFDTGFLSGSIDGTGASLWVQSCSRTPLAKADRMLVTHLTQLKNTDMQLGGEKNRILESWGKLPYLVLCGKAEVELAVKPGMWRVWRLGTDGSRRGEVSSCYRDGRLCFSADTAGDPANATLLYEVAREGLEFETNPDTGGIVKLRVCGDSHGMNWVHTADRRQFKWIGREFAWGLGTLKVDGVGCGWKMPSSETQGKEGTQRLVYRPSPDVEVAVERRLDNGELVERYEFRNVSGRRVSLSEIDINASFNDNYPKDAREMMTRRCHAHVWAGGEAGYVAAMRIGGEAPHLGLMVEEGSLAAYELKERASHKGFSNTRGILCLSPADAVLEPGASTSIGWRVFPHGGWDDFYAKMIARGGVRVRADRYAVTPGEEIAYDVVSAGGTERRTWRCPSQGRHRVEIPFGDGKRTVVEFFGLPDVERLLLNRARFIVSQQQVKDPGSPYCGALVPYDNEECRQYRNWELPKERRRVDTSEGGERHCMGIFLAQMARRGHRDEFLPALEAYCQFVRNHLQEPDYTSYQEVSRPSRKRSFNYPWIATLYLEMHALTGDAKYVKDAYGTLKRLFTGGDIRLPDTLVDLPVKSMIDALRTCSMKAEADEMLSIYRARFGKYAASSATLEIHEVGIAPEQIAGILCQLLDMYELTGESGYLEAVRRIAPATDAMLPHQPSANLNDMALHHWDGYWFGKRRMWGDTCPQDWNGTLADFFRRWSAVTGDESYRRRADGIVRQLLMLFDEDGRGYCVFIYPDRVDGLPGKFRDPLANDQDWSLVFYLRNFR